jgi:hypothetical protein
MAFEKKLNIRGSVIEKDSIESQDDVVESSDMDNIIEDEANFEKYIDSISNFDIRKFAEKIPSSSGNTPKSEVCVIGKFSSGEQILFSKYYIAVVFDSSKGTVVETDSDKLVVGDVLIFAKRDDYTRNMVDYIYEGLLYGDKLSDEVSASTEMALYWKETLRKYQTVNDLSHKAVAARLQKLGSPIQGASVRQWLNEESHIVGPRDEKTLRHIAELTCDPLLLKDTRVYFEAIRIVRRQRKEILGLIGKAITDRLVGNVPPKGSLLESVYENVERLSESFELENVIMLDEPIVVPVNIINKPLTEEAEVFM